MSSPEKIRQRRKLLRSLQTGIFRRDNILHYDLLKTFTAYLQQPNRQNLLSRRLRDKHDRKKRKKSAQRHENDEQNFRVHPLSP